jgi:hypothetical protein
VTASLEKVRAYHYANYHQVQQALTHVERANKQAIGRNDAPTIKSLTSTQLLLVAIKAEARLMKLLYLPDGFTDSQRAEVLKTDSVFDRWTKSVEVGYRAGFSIPRGIAVTDQLLHDDEARYNSIQRVLKDELQPVIRLRNKLAHGQWARPLNAERTEVDATSMRYITSQNAWSLSLRDDALEGIANIVSDLIQSKNLYQSRFDMHYKRVQKLERALRTGSYEEWAKRLQVRYHAGLEKVRSQGGV